MGITRTQKQKNKAEKFELEKAIKRAKEAGLKIDWGESYDKGVDDVPFVKSNPEQKVNTEDVKNSFGDFQ